MRLTSFIRTMSAVRSFIFCSPSWKNISVFHGKATSVISRRNGINVDFQCCIEATQEVTLDHGFQPLHSSTEMTLKSKGSYELEMALMNDNMDQMLDSNTVIQVPEYLNIRIKADEIDPAVFKLVITKCFATPSDNYYNTVNYTFFDNSCPLEHDIIVASNGEKSQTSAMYKTIYRHWQQCGCPCSIFHFQSNARIRNFHPL